MYDGAAHIPRVGLSADEVLVGETLKRLYHRRHAVCGLNGLNVNNARHGLDRRAFAPRHRPALL